MKQQLYVPAPFGLYDIKAALTVAEKIARSAQIVQDGGPLLVVAANAHAFTTKQYEHARKNNLNPPGLGQLNDVAAEFFKNATILRTIRAKCPDHWGDKDCPIVVRALEGGGCETSVLGMLQAIYLVPPLLKLQVNADTDQTERAFWSMGKDTLRSPEQLQAGAAWLIEEFKITLI